MIKITERRSKCFRESLKFFVLCFGFFLGFFSFFLCVCLFFSVLKEFLCFVAQWFKVFFLCSGCITVFCPLAPSDRQRCHWTGRNWLWKNRSLCFANSSSTAGNTSAIICSCPHTNKGAGLSNLRAV